ncbi:hypothetical protein ED733_005736 [Metarhizium rileyi]|uniref:VTC domain-containing protein n=1 Tax=Metarhizium rileyi (strain RCEF 4871) TaxID=1649241 RepID=A0A5C6GCX6_METRR|nr:hypothetical protein ED733_005736 [Metarhizium rileyi]
MDNGNGTTKKKKGLFSGISRTKDLASRKLKAFRDRGGSPLNDGKVRQNKTTPRQAPPEEVPVKIRRVQRREHGDGGEAQRRINGNNAPRRVKFDNGQRNGGDVSHRAVVDDIQRNGSGPVLRKVGENNSIPRKSSRTINPPPAPLAEEPAPSSRRRPRRPKPAPEGGDDDDGSKDGKRKKKVEEDRVETPPPPALTEWPPPGFSNDDELPPQHAVELITRGAPLHKGHKRTIPHAPDNYYALYSTTWSARPDDTDAASPHDSMTPLMTLRLQGPGRPAMPWESLEHPSCAFLYGQRPGTITLNQWVSISSCLPPTIALRDSGVLPRSMDLHHILERLKELQAGLEDDDEGLLYRILYKRILRDPERILNPHKTLDKQITDLLLVLSRPDWIDLTEPKNQVVTRFIFNPEEINPDVCRKFFHQLLLSLELELRIHSRGHGEWARERLLGQIPPTIRWNLALARRWREHVRVDGFGQVPEETNLRYKLKKRQVKVLKRFAHAMKWPNLNPTMENLRIHDQEFRLDTISSDALAFFSGLVLPGPTFPFLIMNTLIDLDPDSATDDLALLSHIHPQCGFQYRNSHTYWSASCIVGKVLAPTCGSVAGWIGPGRPTSDLGRSQIARIRTRRPKQMDRRIGPEDVESMKERSDPLGPAAQSYPVDEYVLVIPDDDSFAVDTVRIELLGFKPVVAMAEDTIANPGPRLFDATVQFAIDGMSWPLRLMYDVSFVAAWPCSLPPHLLFFDYVYRVVKADEVVRVRDWGGLYYRNLRSGSASARSSPAPPLYSMGYDDEFDFIDDDEDDEKVLVVEAYGVADNEVLARAWCSHWGLSAVVADLRRTCMACAIREAYAATITVVIMVDSRTGREDAVA